MTPELRAGAGFWTNEQLTDALRAAGLDVEYRAGSVDTNAGAHKLMDYWVHGKGAAKIRWGEPHDFYRCVAELGKYVGVRAKGLCNVYHVHALGVAPGQEDPHKSGGKH